jgi:hypothetical protein
MEYSLEYSEYKEHAGMKKWINGEKWGLVSW